MTLYLYNESSSSSPNNGKIEQIPTVTEEKTVEYIYTFDNNSNDPILLINFTSENDLLNNSTIIPGGLWKILFYASTISTSTEPQVEYFTKLFIVSNTNTSNEISTDSPVEITSDNKTLYSSSFTLPEQYLPSTNCKLRVELWIRRIESNANDLTIKFFFGRNSLSRIDTPLSVANTKDLISNTITTVDISAILLKSTNKIIKSYYI
jgi:hypothetical protein